MSREAFEVAVVRCDSETSALICVEVEVPYTAALAKGDKVWIPTTRIHADSVVRRRGESGLLVVTRRLAGARGWG